MLVCAFGASITAQGVNHSTGERCGYVQHLADQLKAVYADSEVVAKAAGSSHFDGAGYALLDEVIAMKPDLLLLDWHSTGLTEFDRYLWASAIKKIKDARIRTLIIVFPLADCVECMVERPNILQARSAVGGCISMINMYRHIGGRIDLGQHLRDGIHTTEAGGKRYAEILAETIFLMLSNPQLCIEDPGESVEIDEPEEPAHVDVYSLGASHLKLNGIKLTIECINRHPIYFVAESIIGPFSPIVEITSQSGFRMEQSIWDPWCHYERHNYTQIGRGGNYQINEGSRDIVDIVRIASDPAYSCCRNSEINMPPSNERYLMIKNIYCICGKIIDAFAT